MGEQTTDFLISSIIALFAWFFGGIDGFLSVLITCIVIDWIFGFIDKYIHGKLSIEKFATVLGRKLGELCYVGIAHLFDKYMFGDTATFRTAVTLFYIVVEGKNIISHTTDLGLPVPKFVETRLLELEDKLNKDENITRGESIQKAIGSEIFKEPETPKKITNTNKDLESIYENIYKGEEQ